MKYGYSLFIGLIFIYQINFAQEVLTIDQIMQGQDFVGYSPEDIYWSEDGSKIYFDWNPAQEARPSLYFINIEKGKPQGQPQKVADEQLAQIVPPYGNYNQDRSQKLFTRQGDIFLYKNGKIEQITKTLASESDPQFSRDGQKIFFEKDNNLFSLHLKQATLSQLTDFKSGSEKKDKKKSEQEEWLEKQQMELFEVLRARKANRETAEADQEKQTLPRPKTFYLGEKRLSNLQISPQEDFISFRLTQQANPEYTQVPQFVNESGYTDQDRARPKVGSPDDIYEFGIYDLERDTIFMVDFKQLEGINQAPAYYQDYEREDTTAREVIPHGPFWSDDGRYAVLVVRSLDSKDRWIVSLDAKTGKLTPLDHQRDEAWIGGPGISNWNFTAGNVGWLLDNQHFYFQSEKTGYSHLYTVHVVSGEIKALTSGEFEVTEADLSKDQSTWHLTTNEVHPGEYHFYQMPLKGGKRTRITPKTGMYEATLSPDEKHIALRYSASNQPWELFVMPNQANAQAIQITKSLRDDFQQYSWRAPEIITFPAADGAEVYARLYCPTDPEPQGKAVIFVHGAGYLQNAHKGWSSYYREYMFHNLLVERGYTVLDIDYRASKGYGRDWRTGIYRYMGGKDLSDQVDGAQFLVEKYQISPDRIGIYGGSYGGFITLMAMFTEPGVFKAGAALRSVTDWAHYNHGYTSNILNTPVLDSIAYARSSPINFAEGLEGALLMCHGMVDGNVQFQDIVRLSQRLIELRKENWELAVYPLEPHGFREATSWADEYKRILKLFEENLN